MKPRRTSRRRAISPSGIVQAWSLFLSCDARDMCRAGPTLARLFFSFLAVAVRIVSLGLLLVTDMSPRVFYDIHWASRMETPEYARLLELEAETASARDAWRSGEVSEADARMRASELKREMIEWGDAQSSGYAFDWLSLRENASRCQPFAVLQGRLAVLEREVRLTASRAFCEYLAFQ